MIEKDKLYKKQQQEIIDKIIGILELDEYNCVTLYNLDNNEEKKQKIMNLVPEIRKYYSCNNIQGAREPEKFKRPWLSIIKQICKKQYKVMSSDCTIEHDNKKIRTKKYIFVKLN